MLLSSLRHPVTDLYWTMILMAIVFHISGSGMNSIGAINANN